MQKEMRYATGICFGGVGKGEKCRRKKKKKDTRGLFNLAWGLQTRAVWQGSTRTHHIALCVLNTLDGGCRKCDVNAVLSLLLLQSPLPTSHHYHHLTTRPLPQYKRRQKESLTLRSSKVLISSFPNRVFARLSDY